jgi:HtrA serine peptidase 2
VSKFVCAGGFPILNSFASASDAPINASNQGSGGISDDSRCGRGCLGRDSIANAAAAVGPAVVNISCMHGENVTAVEMINYLPVSLPICSKLVQLFFFVEIHGWALEKSIGSGTIIDPDGTILTCAHVVADFQSTKAILRGKVINLALPVPYVSILSYLFWDDCVNAITNGTIMMHEYCWSS